MKPYQIGSKLTIATDKQPILLSLLTIEKVYYNLRQHSCEWVAAATRGLRKTQKQSYTFVIKRVIDTL